MTEAIALTPRLSEVVKQIKDLKKLTATTGFRTTRSQGEILGRLTADELVVVSRALRER